MKIKFFYILLWKVSINAANDNTQLYAKIATKYSSKLV